jgi:hypothetical protein
MLRITPTFNHERAKDTKIFLGPGEQQVIAAFLQAGNEDDFAPGGKGR